MNITEVKLGRVKNLGNYEKIESSVTVSLVEGDDASKALTMAKDFLSEALGLGANKKPANKTAQTKTSTNVKKEEVKKEEVVAKKEVEVKKEEVKKETKAKTTTVKKPAPTMDDVKNALRCYAEAKKSRDMAVEVMEDVTTHRKLPEVPKKDYAKLIKALAV